MVGADAQKSAVHTSIDDQVVTYPTSPVKLVNYVFEI